MAHYNTGYCTTLLYIIKMYTLRNSSVDVGWQGWTNKPLYSRCSYSILPLLYPLQHIQHGITHCVVSNIMNLVSDPYFVLGIKQTSLHSKEDFHVHTTIWSHTCLSAGSRLHSTSQPQWLYVVSKSNNQASCDLTSQICAHQAFA